MSADECFDFDVSNGDGKDDARLDTGSAFERLIYLAWLANRNGHDETGPRAARPLLRTERAAAFAEWLCLDLVQKLEDLKACARRQGRPPHELVRHWLQPRCYEMLVPREALRPERELFEMDLETLLPILAEHCTESKAITPER